VNGAAAGRGRRVALAIALGALAVLGSAGSAAAQTARIAPCETPRGAECGTVTVPLDHSGRVAGTLPLSFVRSRAAAGPARGTVVFVAGGPGQPGIPLAEELLRGPLEAVAEQFDVVFVDQRGSGRSGALRCSAAPRGTLDVEDARDVDDVLQAIRRCGTELGEARAFFSTYETALDLEDLRRALGLERIVLLGSSYGGQVAGDYARRFPARVQALVLDSTSPIEGVDALSVLPGLALPRVLRELCFPPGCERLFRTPAQEQLGTLARRLVERPLTGRVVLRSGRTERARLTAADLYLLVRASDLDDVLRTELPAAIDAGVRGDAAPLLRLAAALATGDEEPPQLEEAENDVRLLATDCVEGRLPWAPESDPGIRATALAAALRANPGAYEPFPLEAVAQLLLATQCLAWPATPEPPGNGGPGPDVPVLVLGGREDLRTPLEDQRRAAGQFPSAQVLAVPDAGHTALSSDVSGCAAAGVLAFLTGQPVRRCARDERPVPLALPIPQRLGELPAGRARPAVVGRTVTAVQLTVLDAARRLIAGVGTGEGTQVPGLRGGVARLTEGGGLRLVAYEFVPGVRLSGVLRARGTSRLTVAGSGATGRVTLTQGGLLRGTLDGRPVRTRIAGASAAVARAVR